MRPQHILTGRLGERAACRYLLRLGYDILARRYDSGSGELDLVAYDGDVLVFIEVKARAVRDFGEPWEFVDWRKQQHIKMAAAEFIAEHDLGALAWRIDVVSIIAPGTPVEEIVLIRDAF